MRVSGAQLRSGHAREDQDQRGTKPKLAGQCSHGRIIVYSKLFNSASFSLILFKNLVGATVPHFVLFPPYRRDNVKSTFGTSATPQGVLVEISFSNDGEFP
jgi:hypothetical protein